MASITLLKVGAAALLGLGAADLAWINLSLGPSALVTEEPTEHRVTVAVVTTPRADVQREAAPRVDPRPAPAAADPPRDSPIAEPRPPPVAAEPPRARVVSIHFASMSGRIGSTSRAVLAGVVERAGPRDIIHLEGRTDIQGDDLYNEELSKKRVDNAAMVLMSLGIDRARIRRAFVGKRGASDGPEDERWRDRRVDVWLEGARP